MSEKSIKPILSQHSLSSDETLKLGFDFAHSLKPGDVLAFYGNLGSGKTTFIRGICRGLGVEEYVTSPTFTLVNEYKGTMPVFHFDFYRIDDADEIQEIGLEEYLYGTGVCLIEWPEIVRDQLPLQRYELYLTWRFEPDWENKREIRVIRLTGETGNREAKQ